MNKPLGRKAYGSIGHLPQSRLGPGDHKVTEGQARLVMTEPEIRAWLQRLASSDKGRIGRIKELLRYARWDGMSAEDEAICRRCLRELESSVVNVDKEESA